MKNTKLFVLLVFFLLIFIRCERKQNPVALKENPDYSITLNSALYTDGIMLIQGKISNNTSSRIFFPMIQEHPYYDTEGDGFEKKPITVLGLVVNGFKNGERIKPLFGNLPPYGFVIADSNSTKLSQIHQHFDSLYYRKWEILNLNKVNQLKKDKKPYKDSYNWFYRYQGYKKNNFILKPNSYKKIQLSIKAVDLTDMFNDEYFYDLKSSFAQVDSISIDLISDSARLKRDILLQKDIDSLYLNKIKIFNGTIKSNKIPIKRSAN